MGFGIMYYDGKTKMYSTNTNYSNHWSSDIEKAAKIVQQSNAINAAKQMYKNGVQETLHVVEIINVPARFEEIEKPPTKVGYVVFFDNLIGENYFSGPKKSKYRTFATFGVLESSTTFKTEKEAIAKLEYILENAKIAAQEEVDDNVRYKRCGTYYKRMYEGYLGNLSVRKL